MDLASFCPVRIEEDLCQRVGGDPAEEALVPLDQPIEVEAEAVTLDEEAVVDRVDLGEEVQGARGQRGAEHGGEAGRERP